MLKKLFIILLCSTSLLLADQTQEIQFDDVCDSELSPTQKKLAYFWIATDALVFAAAGGQVTGSASPEKTSYAGKVATFVPGALAGFVLSIVAQREMDMMGFYKRHKWTLYVPFVAVALGGAASLYAHYGMLR